MDPPDPGELMRSQPRGEAKLDADTEWDEDWSADDDGDWSVAPATAIGRRAEHGSPSQSHSSLIVIDAAHIAKLSWGRAVSIDARAG